MAVDNLANKKDYYIDRRAPSPPTSASRCRSGQPSVTNGDEGRPGWRGPHSYRRLDVRGGAVARRRFQAAVYRPALHHARKRVKIVVNRPRITGERLLAAEVMGGSIHGWIYFGGPEGGRVHLWYTTSDHRYVGVAYALSTNDGATFIRPDLGIVDYEARSTTTWSFSALRDARVRKPSGLAEERTLLVRSRAGPPGQNRLFNSPDGLHWRQEGKVPFVDVQKYKYLTLIPRMLSSGTPGCGNTSRTPEPICGQWPARPE